MVHTRKTTWHPTPAVFKHTMMYQVLTPPCEASTLLPHTKICDESTKDIKKGPINMSPTEAGPEQENTIIRISRSQNGRPTGPLSSQDEIYIYIYIPGIF